MLILALESSAKTVSAALVRDGERLAYYYQNCGLTHSKTLLPMINSLMENAGIKLEEVDLVAVAHGPGSFTGVRIGVSTAKGLCWALDKPAAGVSTLEAMAYNALEAGESRIICCAMDARRNQVYNALFEIKESIPRRLCEDRAISLEELASELNERGGKYVVVGDGAELCHTKLVSCGIDSILGYEAVRMQSAYGVALAAQRAKQGSVHDLLPTYLRLSQAERERQTREKS